MNRFRDNSSMHEMYKRFQAATTPWPAHVYETHNISNIIEKARTQLAQHKIDREQHKNDPKKVSGLQARLEALQKMQQEQQARGRK